MANKLPWFMMQNQQPTQAELEAQLLAGTGVPGLGKMAADAVPGIKETDPPSDQIGAKQTSPANLLPGATSVSISTKERSSDPSLDALAASLRAQYDRLRGSRLIEEEAGVQDYQDKMSQYENKARGIDWRPLAGLLDNWAGSNVASNAATATMPETEQDKQAKLMAMREKLQGMKGAISKTQFDAIKDQMDSVKAQMMADASEQRLAASLNSKMDTQGRLRNRDDDKDLMEFQKRIMPHEKVDNVIREIEDSLGFNLQDFDPATGTVNGESVNLPGTSSPIFGRINQGTPEARRLQTKIQKLVNTVLKERSGAAVTDSEMQRILDEFATRKGKLYTEADVFGALRDYATILEQDKKMVMRGFRPIIVDTYYNPQGTAASYERKSDQAQTGSASGGLTEDKRKRLEELRRKKAEGTIGQ